MVAPNFSIKREFSSATFFVLDLSISQEARAAGTLRKCRRTTQQDSLVIFQVSKVRLRAESKMMEDSLCATSSNRMVMKSPGILGHLMVSHLLWGRDLIKTNDSYNKSLFCLDRGFK